MTSKNLKAIFPIVALFILGSLCIVSCKEEPRYKPSYSHENKAKKTLVLGVATTSFYEPTELIVQYINKNIKTSKLIVRTGSSYDDYLKKIKSKEYDFFFANGLVALEAEKNGYHIAAKYGDDETYYSVIYVNKNSNITKIEDLKGKKFILSARKSMLGGIAPLLFLQKNGIDINHDLTFTETASFESGILNVYLNKYDAGAAWVTMWDRYVNAHPEILNKVEVKWKTPHLINLALLVKNDVDPKKEKEIVDIMLNLNKHREGRFALKQMDVSKIEKANSNTYAPLKELQKKIANW